MSVVGGTAAYMAPELRGHIRPSQFSDVFALGVLMFMAMLPSGSEHTTNTGVRDRIEDSSFPSPSPKPLLLAMTNDNPAERPTIANVIHDPFIAVHNLVSEQVSRREAAETDAAKKEQVSLTVTHPLADFHQ